MKKTLILLKEIRNYKDGYHLNSKHWQKWKINLPPLPLELKRNSYRNDLERCLYVQKK